MLRGNPSASFVARALHPHLAEEVGLHDLTASIAVALPEATEAVARLYAEPVEAAPADAKA